MKIAGAIITVALSYCAPQARPELVTIAFCGVNNPSTSLAWQQARVMHDKAGIDVTMGPCLPPGAGYSPAWPGVRQAGRATYLELVVANANAGMQTIVYDPGFWDDPGEAVAFWSPHARWIYAIDMGDEPMPGTADWAEILRRRQVIEDQITPALGVGPFSNYVGDAQVIERALLDAPNQWIDLNFDLYLGDGGVELARLFDQRVKTLGCAVNTLRHETFLPTPKSVTAQMRALRDAGCDRFIVFGGAPVVDTPGYTSPSLVDSRGRVTSMAAAVLAGAR